MSDPVSVDGEDDGSDEFYPPSFGGADADYSTAADGVHTYSPKTSGMEHNV